MQVGDIIMFDKYEWRVLAIQNSMALLITEYIVEKRAYHEVYKDITWAECSLRKYLNDEFYNTFTKDNQSRIIPVNNKNCDNQWYGSIGGVDTKDKIFLLSLEEATCLYLGDSSSKLHNPGKNQRYWFERKDENNDKRIAKFQGDTWNSWWWIRTPGRVSLKAVYVHGHGNIGIQGNNILKGNIADGECLGGVRPALWLKM